MINDFDVDLLESKIITAFLDKFFYDRLKSDGAIEDFTRYNSDKEVQFDGVDVVIKSKGKSFLIDEKAQAHYGKRPLPTFAFETSYLNKAGEKKEGWLTDKKKRTDFWLVVWPTIKHDGKLFYEDDIQKMELMLIARKSLLSYFEQYGWDTGEITSFD